MSKENLSEAPNAQINSEIKQTAVDSPANISRRGFF
jgi:hypothetical protein